MLIAYFRRSKCVPKCGYWLNRILNFPMTMSYFIIAQCTWHGLIGPFYVPSPLDGPPIHISSFSHVLDPSCYVWAWRERWRERWFVSQSSICRLELGFYVWVDFSLPFLPLTHVKIKSSFIYYLVCFSAQSSRSRARLFPCKV